MPISVSCPDCGKTYLVNESLAGRKARCKACGRILRIPRDAAPEPEPEADPQAGVAPTGLPESAAGGQDAFPELTLIPGVGRFLWMTFMALLVTVSVWGGLWIMSDDKGPAPPPPPPKFGFHPPLQADNRGVLVAPPNANVLKGQTTPTAAFIDNPVFSLGNCQVIRKAQGLTDEVEFRIEYKVIGAVPAGIRYFAVVESRASQSDFSIPRVTLPNGNVSWTSTLKDGDTGPFRAFLATVQSGGPRGRSWAQASKVVSGIPLTDSEVESTPGGR